MSLLLNLLLPIPVLRLQAFHRRLQQTPPAIRLLQPMTSIRLSRSRNWEHRSSRLTKLELLNLNRTEITDAGLSHLKKLTNLQTLFLKDTKVTDAGIPELQEALPNCETTK